MGALTIGMIAPPWFDVPPLGYGGIESMCFQLVEGLVSAGHRVTLIAAGLDGTHARFVQSYVVAPSARVGDPLPEVIHAAVAEEALRDISPDIVHDHSLAGPLLAFSRDVPTVVSAHGPVHGEFGAYYGLIGRAVQLVAISNAQRRLAPDLPWIGTVHNAIPVAEYPYRPVKDDYVLWLGRMSETKGVDTAIAVAKDAGVRLVMAGKCSEATEQEYFERVVAPHVDNDGVDWIGEAKTEQKKALLAGARALLFPIRWEEPFGIVMVEALACGTPVIGFRKGSVPEVVSDGETGFICDEAAQLVEAVGKVADLDPAACRKRAEELFDTGVMVRGYEAVYKQILDN